MASQTGFCGDGCSFDTVDIDCSMAFRMVESTIRRIMGGLEERKGDEIVFAGLIKSGDAVSMVLNSHKSSKFLSSIPPQPPSFDPSPSPPSPCSYSSSAPLLAQSSSVPQKLEELSPRESPQAVSSPFPPPWGSLSQTENHPRTSATSHRQQLLPSSRLFYLPVGLPDCEQSRPSSRARGKVNTFSSPSASPKFRSRRRAGIYPSIQGVLAQVNHSKSKEGSSLRPKKARHLSSSKNIKEPPVRSQGNFFDAHNLDPASVLSLRKSSSPSVERLKEFEDLVPLLPYCFPLGTSESSKMTGQKGTAARRIDTPPKSIFDDYQSAYNTILSPGRNFIGSSEADDPAQSSNVPEELPLPNNPFIDLFSGSECPGTPPRMARPGTAVTPNRSHKSQRPSSPKSRRRTNFSRPLSLSPSSDRLTKPVTATVRDSVSMFSLESPVRLSHDKRPNTKQPNLQGARGRVEKSSTIGSIVKKYGDESGSNRRSTEGDRDVEVRTSLEIIGCGQSVLEGSSMQSEISPAGQPPNIPLPPDPSYVAARGIIGEAVSEASLYEDTEKLLNLTQASGANTIARQKTSQRPYQSATAREGALNSEFSWMGNKGKTSFRDLSAKELKQLPNPSRDSQGSLAGDGAEVPVDDSPSGDQYLLSDAVYQSQNADRLVNAKRRTKLLSQHLAKPLTREDLARFWDSPSWDDDENSEAGSRTNQDLQTDSVLDFGGLQSSSSRGVSLDVSLREDAFRREFSNAESSRAAVVGGEIADNASLSIRAKGGKTMRSAGKDVEDNPFRGGESDEEEEWETLGESGIRSKLGTQVSLGRSTSGSSLANVSSNESTEEDRGAPSPWDPLRAYPALITPPSEAVIRQSRRHNSQVQEPATVPRYAPPPNEENRERTLKRTSSTPVLSFSLTPKNQIRRGTSPTYRHPTPLNREHQNPFSSSPPSVDVQNQGPSFELSELGDKHTDKRHAIYANSIHSLHQQIHKPATSKNQTHLKNSFTNPDMSSEKSVDGSYSTMNPTDQAEDGSSILNPNSPRTPKSTKSFTKGSGKRTKLYLNGSPEDNLTESARYQRVREEMGCGTGGIARVPGMQQVAPPRAHIPEQFIGPTKPFRAADPLPKLPPRNSFELTHLQPLTRSSTKEEITDRMILANDDMSMMKKKCPTFPITDQMLKTYFRNSDGTLSKRPKAKRGTVFERDGRTLEQAYCDGHQRWEFSHPPRLTRRMPKEDIKVQREMGRKLITILFVSVVGWIFLVFIVAWDPMNGRGELIREFSNGAVQTFHQREIVLARVATGVIVAVVAVLLVLVGLFV